MTESSGDECEMSTQTSSQPSLQISSELPAEARDPTDDWSGVTDPAKRRKLQNRLHQRAWRRREAERRRLKETEAKPNDCSMLNVSLVDAKSIQTTSGASNFHASLCKAGKEEFLQTLARFEKSLQDRDLKNGPRLEMLASLIKFNVYRALRMNNESLGFDDSWGTHDAISPFYSPRTHCTKQVDALPIHLRPTSLQRTIEHHPWIDLLPVPAMRDNILQLGDDYDDAPLCYDILDDMSQDRSGLVVWGDPWRISSWEITERFAERWPWVLQGCLELLEATNEWRMKRGEPRLFPVTALRRMKAET